MTAIFRHRIARYVVGAAILIAFLSLLGPFTVPLLVAALLAFAIDPLLARFPMIREKRGLWAILFILMLFIVISAPVILVGFRLVGKAREISGQGLQNTPIYVGLQKAVTAVGGHANAIAAKLDVDLSQLPDPGELLSKGGARMLAIGGGLLGHLPDFILATFIFAAALYFFVVQSRAIRRFADSLDLLSKREITGLIKVVQSSSYSAFVSTFVVGVIQASVVTVGAALCGYREFLLVFVPTFFFSLIPVIGAAPMAFILAAVSFSQGETASGIGLVVTGLFAGVVDNIVKPILVNRSGDDDVHPVIALVTIIGAIIVYGMPGLILGPIVTRLLIQGLPILFRSEPV